MLEPVALPWLVKKAPRKPPANAVRGPVGGGGKSKAATRRAARPLAPLGDPAKGSAAPRRDGHRRAIGADPHQRVANPVRKTAADKPRNRRGAASAQKRSAKRAKAHYRGPRKLKDYFWRLSDEDGKLAAQAYERYLA